MFIAKVRPGVTLTFPLYGKTQTGSHRTKIDPHVTQEGALACISLVTGGTSLEWPDPTGPLWSEQRYWPK